MGIRSPGRRVRCRPGRRTGGGGRRRAGPGSGGGDPIGRDRENVALGNRHRRVKAGTQAGQRVLAQAKRPGFPAEVPRGDHGDQTSDHARDPPIDPGQLVSEPVERAASPAGQTGRRAELGGLGKFGVQGGEHRRDVHLQESRAGADRAADVDRCREGVVIGGFQGFDVIAADLGQFRQIVQGETLRLSSLAKLFGHRRHFEGNSRRAGARRFQNRLVGFPRFGNVST